MDTKLRLNYKHEYQIVFIEPGDGTHVFMVKLGAYHPSHGVNPFDNRTGADFTIPEKVDPYARFFKVLDRAQNVVFNTTAKSKVWHNFGVQIDWDAKTLAVLYSHNENHLKVVTKAVSNDPTSSGSTTQGEFHWGVLKVTNNNDLILIYIIERTHSP